MREEVKRWLQQAEEDFDSAKYNFNGGKYYVAAFFCQQSVEKILKALFLFEKKGAVPQSHSLIYLAKNTSVPEKFFSFLRELTPKFIDTRYPDVSVDLPSIATDLNNSPICQLLYRKKLSFFGHKNSQNFCVRENKK